MIVVPVFHRSTVRRAAYAAELIDGSREGVRLPGKGAPAELRPLVSAFNRALDRIDVAHRRAAALSLERRPRAAHAARPVRTRLERVSDGQLRA